MKKHHLSNGLRKIRTVFKTSKFWARISFFILGISSTIWFLARVIPKPSRATYPCMRAAAPLMSGFVIYILSITGSAFAFKKFRKKLASAKYLMATLFLLAALVMIVTANISTKNEVNAINLVSASYFMANSPIGTANGLKPGRVVWVWDSNATDENLVVKNNKNNWWANYTNKDEVDQMLNKAITGYSDKETLSEAWNDLFSYYNKNHGKGEVGYKSGEKIYIKINLTNSCCSVSGTTKTTDYDRVDNTPELLLALLKELTEEVGVDQSDIYLGDPFRTFHDLFWNTLHTAYPNVIYCDGIGKSGRHQTVPTTEHAIFFSDGINQCRLPQEIVDSDYLINVPCLKTHDSGGITLGAKNFQGTILQDGGSSSDQSAMLMHYSLPYLDDSNGGNHRYRHLVDYLGHKDLGGKTLVTILDGIWAGKSWEGYIEKWNMAPFNGDYPSSIFVSQDKIAIDAVGYDFLLEEYKNKSDKESYAYMAGVDDYLYQASDTSYWPDGIKYDPEGDGTTLKSLGVYEHWNNATDKNYSRNLGSGEGIELVKVNLGTAPLTADNSGLVSSKINKIFVDSFDVKWFGTEKGLSRYDGENWITYDTTNYLKNDNVNDIAYEKTKYGNELWVATNGGLSVMSFDIDGVTSATTYYVGGPESGIISDTVNAVGVDINHTRWIATPKGINTFGTNGWDTTNTYMDGNREVHDWNRLKVNEIGSYEKNGYVYLGTVGQGVLRMSYDEVDGFTGASALSHTWSGLWSDTVYSVSIYDTIQWYGTNLGAFEHFGPSTKNYWDFSLTPYDSLLNSVVKDIEKDNSGNIWIGTEKGLHVITSNGVYKYATGTQSSNLTTELSYSTNTLMWTPGNGFIGSMLNEKINDIQKDYSGNVWVASDSGVEIYKSVPGVLNDVPTKRVVFITKTTSGTITPSNGTTYTGNAEFKKGTANGNWYCVYNGTGTSVDLTGLTSNTTYRAAVFDYYGEPGQEVYSTAVGVNNPISFTTGTVGKKEFARNIIKTFPIPFNDFLILQIDLDSSKSYKVSISNLDGKVFKQVVIDSNNQQIVTSDLAKGVYLLRISNGEKEQVIKIIK